MKTFTQKIKDLIDHDEILFYNTSGDPQAYKLGVKHLGSAIFLGFAELIHDVLYVKKDLLLVDLERQTITQIFKGDKLTLTPLELEP